MIYLELFWAFLQVGLFSIGGGYAALPLIQNQVVELNPWISMGEFTDLITIAEMTPGPIAINAATFVGIRIGGIGGGLVATLGCIVPSLIIVSVMAYVYYRWKGLTLLQSILASLRPAVVALIASAGLSILMQVAFSGGAPSLQGVDFIGLALFTAAFIAIRRFKCHPILAIALCGAGRLVIGLLMGAV